MRKSYKSFTVTYSVFALKLTRICSSFDVLVSEMPPFPPSLEMNICLHCFIYYEVWALILSKYQLLKANSFFLPLSLWHGVIFILMEIFVHSLVAKEQCSVIYLWLIFPLLYTYQYDVLKQRRVCMDILYRTHTIIGLFHMKILKLAWQKQCKKSVSIYTKWEKNPNIKFK